MTDRHQHATASTKRRSTRRPGVGSLIILAAVVVGVGLVTPTINQLIEQQVRISQLRQDIDEANQQTNALRTEQRRWSDPAYIRSQARGRLLFVNPGDTSYTVIDAGKQAAVRVPVEVSVEQHTTTTDSNALYLDSLIRAAKADEQPKPDQPKQEQP
ncbi:septum formation initiator family protein [uncultured Gulosibacter sp.]|uniref:FtsB family cell division protein n=1 Tax=uncultured Gulosibacter sp. TaxID=1339167 RepID=UPI002889AD7B|nr:septum formation initiator family protein [uncultured Gulosibacter sp.]